MSFVRTSPNDSPIVVEASFDAPPATVFAAWTQPARVKQWFGLNPGSLAEASIDLSPGGRWRFVEADTADGRVGFEGVYLEITTDCRLVFSWTKFTERSDGTKTTTPTSEVEITLTASAIGTDMRIVHSAVDPAAGFALGWEAGTTNLAGFLAPQTGG